MDNVVENMESNGNGRDSSGRFSLGHNGFKKAGLPEFQRTTREKLWAFFEAKIEGLPAIFEKLSPSNQARVLLSIAEFFHPKQKEIYIDAVVEQQGPHIDYSRLSESALREIISLTTSNKQNEPDEERI